MHVDGFRFDIPAIIAAEPYRLREGGG